MNCIDWHLYYKYMKRVILIGLLLVATVKSFSQDSKFSIEVNHPIPIDKNFVGENYHGIIDGGIKYRFADFNLIKIGASFNGGILLNQSNKDNGLQDFVVRSYLLQPKIFAELGLKSITKFHPFVGIGYTWMIFSPKGTNNWIDISGENQTESGVNVNFGVAYDILERLFVQLQYDFIKLQAQDGVPDTEFNRNVNILKIGVGLRL